jgi:hypothetical protein
MSNDIFVGSKINKVTIDETVFNLRNVYDSKYIKERTCYPILLRQITQGYLIRLLSDTKYNVVFCDDE